MRNVIIISFILLLLMSCAKPVKPHLSESLHTLKIEKHYQTVGYVRDFTFYQNYLFATVDQSGFSVFDLSTDTLVINYTQYLSTPRIIKVAQTQTDTLLFVYDLYGSPASINCFNIHDVKNPQYLAPIITDTGGIEDMDIIVTQNDTLRITYTKNDASSHKIKMFDTVFSNYIWSMYPQFDADQIFDYDVHRFCKYDENTYYIANEQKGIAAIDISDVYSPTLLTYIDTPGSAYDVKRVDNYLYVADKHEGLEVFKFTDSEDWEMIYHYDTSGYAKQLAIKDNIVAVASGGGGVYLFDISNPDSPELYGHIDDDEIGYTYKVKFVSDNLYVGTRLGVYKLGSIFEN